MAGYGGTGGSASLSPNSLGRASDRSPTLTPARAPPPASHSFREKASDGVTDPQLQKEYDTFLKTAFRVFDDFYDPEHRSNRDLDSDLGFLDEKERESLQTAKKLVRHHQPYPLWVQVTLFTAGVVLIASVFVLVFWDKLRP